MDERAAIGLRAPFRFPRAIAFTAAMFALASGAHVLAGGTLPALPIFAGLVALAMAPVMILARVRITAPVTGALIGGGQLVLHEAFSALSVSVEFTPAAGSHVHGPGPVAPYAAALMPGHVGDPGVLMLALHAAATLGTAMVLARGEAALWALAAWLRPLVRILTAVVIPDWPHLPAPDLAVIASRWRSLRLPALRGPPPGEPAL